MRIKIRANGTGSEGFTLGQLLGIMVFIGILMAVILPKMMGHITRAKQAEAKVNLNSAYLHARIYYQNNGNFLGKFSEIGFMPEGEIRYSYASGAVNSSTTDPIPINGLGVCSGGGQSQNKNPHCTSKITPGSDDAIYCFSPDCNGEYTSTIDPCGAGPGLGKQSAKTFCYVAYGNLDNDPAIDIWTINHMGALNNGGQYECTGANQVGGFCKINGIAIAGDDSVYDIN